jgi:hypothetical protein
MTNMFIPKRIRVGFKERKDTFTGKLSYIIYYDEKGKIRKETSWDGWRDKNFDFVEFDNVPQNGYIFNKGIKRDGYWGSGRSVIRVYDPRDFEFEISVDNLMGVLMHSDVSKRDIVEKCIFAWNSGELVLLPVNSQEYEASVAYTQKQDQKISSKELVPGYTYQAKKIDTPLIYVGKYEWFDWSSAYEKNGALSKKNTYANSDYWVEYHESKGLKHVFYDGEQFITKTPADLSAVLTNFVDSNYQNVVDLFFSGHHSQKIVSVSLTNEVNSKDLYFHDRFYFISNNNLFTVFLGNENIYKNGSYLYRPSISYDSNIALLSYPNSLYMKYTNHISNPELDKIAEKFETEFSEYYPNYDEQKEKVEKWLLNNGIYKTRIVILENGKQVMKNIIS